jgi:hypothetical protein
MQGDSRIGGSFQPAISPLLVEFIFSIATQD